MQKGTEILAYLYGVNFLQRSGLGKGDLARYKENKNSEQCEKTQAALMKERPPEGKGGQKYHARWEGKENESYNS